VVQEDSYRIYFVNFRHSYKFLRIFEVYTIFLEFKTIKKHLKTVAQYWVETGPRLQPTGRGGLLRAVGWKADWVTAWQPNPAEKTAYVARGNARAARSWRGHGARSGLAGGKVLPASTGGARAGGSLPTDERRPAGSGPKLAGARDGRRAHAVSRTEGEGWGR
jgi:hypothetical protein